VCTRVIRTFLAEDSPLLMALLARIMSNDQRVLIVGSAMDGRKAFCNASTLAPDLVITDLNMPGMDGSELTLLLKQLPNPPVVFVATADDTPEAREGCMAAGANAFLVKAGNLAPRLLSAIQEFFPDDLDSHHAESNRFRERSPQENQTACASIEFRANADIRVNSR
jgi:DNA-binding NarL/FixJ family response regulator